MDFSVLKPAYAGKRVLVTGHTGFKGAWLSEWLLDLGADVHGIALEPEERSLFNAIKLGSRMHHHILDVRDASALQLFISGLRPHFIFHLAAQPLVRQSYREPLDTFSTNVMGTVNLLEALRVGGHACTIVLITSDKAYANDGRPRAFREIDPLGGHDPYSASKGAAEIVTSSYRESFFSHDTRIGLATARAGNVIGGGDWAADRIVPDVVRALENDETIPVRNPKFTRPWQHVLEPLGGYLLLGAKLEAARGTGHLEEMKKFAAAFNFGPDPTANRPVSELVDEILKHWPGKWESTESEKLWHEAPVLSLDITKAREVLGWQPRWDFAHTVKETVMWYRAAAGAHDPLAPTQAQIATYSSPNR